MKQPGGPRALSTGAYLTTLGENFVLRHRAYCLPLNANRGEEYICPHWKCEMGNGKWELNSAKPIEHATSIVFGRVLNSWVTSKNGLS